MMSWSRSRLHGALRTWLILALLLTSVALLNEFVLDRSGQRMATEFMLMASLVVAIQAYVGNSGLLSFGHVAFFAVGAYTAGLVTIPPTRRPGTCRICRTG